MGEPDLRGPGRDGAPPGDGPGGPAAPPFAPAATLSEPRHFRLRVEDAVAYVTLDRPERKNPLTFDSYAELRDFFRDLTYRREIKAVVISGAGSNFCSGGDVHDIIAPL